MTTPAYYLRGGEEYQPRVIAKRLGLTFDEGNLLKYLLRAGHKPGVSRLEDLEKLLDLAQKMVDEERAELAAKTPEPFVGVHCPATGGECKGRCVGATCEKLERATVVGFQGSERHITASWVSAYGRETIQTGLLENLVRSLCGTFPDGWVGTHNGRRYGGGMIDGAVYLTPVLDVRDR